MKPSEVKDRYWVYESIRFSFSSTYSTGKWLIDLPQEELDETWEKIVTALRDHRLGPAAKASTAIKNPTQVDFQRAMIVVYVESYWHEMEKRSVLKALRRLGIKGKLKFKRDIETFRGKYGKDSFWAYARGNKVIKYKWTTRLQKCVSV